MRPVAAAAPGPAVATGRHCHGRAGQADVALANSASWRRVSGSLQQRVTVSADSSPRRLGRGRPMLFAQWLFVGGLGEKSIK